MGDFTEHVLFGFLAGAVVSYFLKGSLNLAVPEALVATLAITVGSVLPDIDHKNAYVHRAAKAFASIGAGIFSVVFLPFPVHFNFVIGVGAFLIVYIGFSSIKMRHRGFTHSLSFLAIVSSVAVISSVSLFTNPLPGMAAGLGILSHLLLDREIKMT